MADVKLGKNERIDQLYSNNIKIIQSDDVFSFSIDAVMLANFAKIKRSSKTKVVDLCAGNGAVGLFISHKTNGKIYEVEIQKRLAEMAERSVAMNDLEEKISVINDDLNNATKIFAKESIDEVIVNPPYFTNDLNSKKNPNKYLAIARHEIKTNLHEVVKTASELLKVGGKFYMVHRPDRLYDIFAQMNPNRLAPKTLQFVYPKKRSDANMVLVSGIKDGHNKGLKVLEPIYIYDGDEYSPKVRKMLYGK